MSRFASALLFGLLAHPAPEGLRSPIIVPSDYTTIPAAPAEIAKQVSACKVSLAQAAEAAAKAAGGVVGSVRVGGPKGAPVYEVAVYAEGKATLVAVDGLTGAVGAKTDVARFPGDPTKGDWVETPSGLKYYDLRVGDGPKPASPNVTVKVHFAGWLLDGQKFYSTYDQNEPAVYPLNNFMPGWQEGVGDMRVGGKRKLVIPPTLAYGDRPPQGMIPPKATLVFDVELLEIVK